jgi:thiamine biosynthesis lipoprotein
MSVSSPPNAETIERFTCFGGNCTVIVEGAGPARSAADAAARARRSLLAWHEQFSRFDPSSELSSLNTDSRTVVPVSPVMVRFAEAALWAAAHTRGLVDPTLVGEIERAGYAGHFDSAPLPLSVGLRLAPPRLPAGSNPERTWRQVSVNRVGRTVHRPPGIRLDSGGIAKGLFADLLAATLERHAAFAVEAAGDIRFGGAAGLVRPVQVASPFGGSILHTFGLTRGAAATSGIGRRSWLDARGRPAHHLLDAATGRPAFTGIVQATALAPSAVEAEALAKAALLSGPEGSRGWLPHGGLVVYDDGSYDVIDEAAR